MQNNGLKLDYLDKEILKVLQQDSSISNLDLARHIKLAPSSTLQRVKALHDKGIIKRVVSILDANLLGFSVRAFVDVTLVNQKKDTLESFLQIVRNCDQVLECYITSGTSTLTLKCIATNFMDFDQFLVENLTSNDLVIRTETKFILEECKDTTQIPLK